MCPLALPSNTLTLGEQPLLSDLLWYCLTSKELPLGFKNLKEVGAEFYFNPSYRTRLERGSVFSIYLPTFCLFNHCIPQTDALLSLESTTV